MHTFIAWSVLTGLGLYGVYISAEAPSPVGLLIATFGITLLLAAVAIAERRRLIAQAAGTTALSATSALYLGLIWLWGAVAIAVVYIGVLNWREWPLLVAAFGIAGLVSLGFWQILSRDAARGHDDQALLKLSRQLTIVQFAGMLITIAGLLIDPDKEFLYPVDGDWAANGICLSGALALALVSAHALGFLERPSKALPDKASS